jgi:hypothetical protein
MTTFLAEVLKAYEATANLEDPIQLRDFVRQVDLKLDSMDYRVEFANEIKHPYVAEELLSFFCVLTENVATWREWHTMLLGYSLINPMIPIVYKYRLSATLAKNITNVRADYCRYLLTSIEHEDVRVHLACALVRGIAQLDPGCRAEYLAVNLEVISALSPSGLSTYIDAFFQYPPASVEVLAAGLRELESLALPARVLLRLSLFHIAGSKDRNEFEMIRELARPDRTAMFIVNDYLTYE